MNEKDVDTPAVVNVSSVRDNEPNMRCTMVVLVGLDGRPSSASLVSRVVNSYPALSEFRAPTGMLAVTPKIWLIVSSPLKKNELR